MGAARPSTPRPTAMPAGKAAAGAESSDQSGSSSYALPLLIFIVIGLIAGNACFRLWRRQQLRQEQADWRRQETRWDAVVRQVETERGQSERGQPAKSGSGPDASPPQSAVGLLTRAGTGPAGESRRDPGRSRP